MQKPEFQFKNGEVLIRKDIAKKQLESVKKLEQSNEIVKVEFSFPKFEKPIGF